MIEPALAARLDALLAARGRASAEDLGLSAEELLTLGLARPDVEGIFLVRLRSRVGSVRIEEIRAEAWPARRVVERDEGYFAEGALLVRLEPRQEVPFPLRLYAEPSQAGDAVDRVRRATRVLVRATSLAGSRPRRAEQTLRTLEPLFEEISPDAAGLFWIEVVRTFAALGDVERARRASHHLATLARRAPVSAAILGRALGISEPPGEGASIVSPDLVEVAAERLEPRAGLALRLDVLGRLLAKGRYVPAGTVTAIERAADDSVIPNAKSMVDAALLGAIGLVGVWSPNGDAAAVRARITELWRSAGADGSSGRTFLGRAFRSLLALLDAPRLSCVLETLLPASRDELDARLVLDVTFHLLDVFPKVRTPSEEDTTFQALLHVARTNGHVLRERQSELSQRLSRAFVLPNARPLLDALLADLDEAETTALPMLGLRIARERALARWLPEPLLSTVRGALRVGAERLTASPAVAFVVAVRLIGLAQDERTEDGLAIDALALAEGLAERLDDAPIDLGEVDPALHLAQADPLALRDGIKLSREYLERRDALRPERWPAPSIAGLPDPRDARFVLLAWVFGALEAREVRSHHLAFARIAASTPLVRAGAGRLTPPPSTRKGASSAFARLTAAAVARAPLLLETSLRDVVLLCSPLELAEAFAREVGGSPHGILAASASASASASAAASVSAPVSAPVSVSASVSAPVSAPVSAFPVPERDPALPGSPEIAGHVVSLDARGELVVLGARGVPLRRVPASVRRDDAYRALVRGRRAERQRRRRAVALLEARMTSALSVGAEELTWLLDDPLHASLLRGLVIAPSTPERGPPCSPALLWGWDRARGLGVVPLDYDARWIGWPAIEVVHPARLSELGAWRELARELGVRQSVPQIARDLRSIPDDELDRDESRALASRHVGSARALLRELEAEGFTTGRALATRSFVHKDISCPLELWFDPGSAAWPDDAVVSGAFGFREPDGRTRPLSAIPLPIVCEARLVLERALARAASRGG